MREVPAEFVRITSGLGEAVPRSVLIVPLKTNDEVFGLIEMASFTDVPQHRIEFIEKFCDLFASTIASVKVAERTRRLLHESQQQAEELRAQEEEMRQNMEELTATQEEMSRKDLEVSSYLNAINAACVLVETNAEGAIVDANERFCEMTGYGLQQLKKIYLAELVTDPAVMQEVWRTLRKGQTFASEIAIKTQRGDKLWLQHQWSPVRNAAGSLQKVIGIGIDITRYKTLLSDAMPA